jgi:hypothetical protein
LFFIKPVITFVPNSDKQAPSTVTYTHTLLLLRGMPSIISPAVCLTTADMLSLFKNILYKTYVYFVMSLVSAVTDPNLHTPHIPSSRSRVYFLLPGLFRTPSKDPNTVLHFTARHILLRCVTRRLELGTLLVMKCGCGISST